MDYSMIAAPVIGAVIGYATNYIAVKMLFRPMEPIQLFGKTLPFTPGIIPKGKPRIAKAIGAVVSTHLLSKEMLRENLLADSMKEKIASAVTHSLSELTQEEKTLNDVLTQAIPEEKLTNYKEKASEYVADRIDERLKSQPVGGFISSQVIQAVKEHLKGGILGMMLNDNVLNPIGTKIETQINSYLDEHAKELAQPIIAEECDQLLNQKISSLTESVQEKEDIIAQNAVKAYTWIVDQKIDTIVKELDIAQMVETQINQMNMKELETLILSVMKKELNALVNLGALIGFLLGLFNLLF